MLDQSFKTLFEKVPYPILIADDQMTYTAANAAAAELLGLSTEEIVGRKISDFISPSRAWDEFQQARHRSGEITLKRPDGTERVVEFSAVSNVLPGRHLSVFRDVTEKKLLENRLLLADRLTVMGSLAAGVAHEINNPLTYVLANLELIQEDLAKFAAGTDPHRAAAEIEHRLAQVKDGVERVRCIVRDLKRFSRSDENCLSPIDVHEPIDKSIEMASNEIRHRARLVRRYGKLPRIQANETRLGQVFLNLLVNAAQAIEKGTPEENVILIETFHDPAGWIRVEISDSGVGIPKENLSHLFEPFFTTKPIGTGTGLGLAVCHEIVNALGGRIEARSELGRGATFSVSLPIGIAALPAGEPAAAQRPRTSPVPLRILVIDDEPALAETIEFGLRREHKITLCSDPDAALSLLDGGAQVDLILCDILMPGKNGMDLYQELEERYPHLTRRIIFMTGGAFTKASQVFLNSVQNRILEKPFHLADLRRIVQEVADDCQESGAVSFSIA